MTDPGFFVLSCVFYSALTGTAVTADPLNRNTTGAMAKFHVHWGGPHCLDKISGVLRWSDGLTTEAAVRPPSIPGLNRRSGRIPALPCRPIKPLDCTAVAVCSKAKTSILENESDKSQGVWGTASPIRKMTSSF